jgi:hypothetical protein
VEHAVSEQVAGYIWIALAAYLTIGAAIGALTLLFGLTRLEPSAAGMAFRVRALIAPGLMALWPLVLVRLSGRRGKEDQA